MAKRNQAKIGHNMWLIAGAVAFLRVGCPTSWADTGDYNWVYHDVGNSGNLIRAEDDWYPVPKGENPDIAMEAEEVVITLHPDVAEVEATFEFKNYANTQVVEMFFPLNECMLSYEGSKEEVLNEYTTKRNKKGRLYKLPARVFDTNFTVTVDGEKTGISIKNAIISEGFDFRADAVWKVKFKKGEEKEISCHYIATYSGGPGFLTNVVEYAVYTGATWRGSIGRGKIVVKPGEDFDWSLPMFYFGKGVVPARDEGAFIVWEFEDFEPPYEGEFTFKEEIRYNKFGFNYSGLRVGFIPAVVLAPGYEKKNYYIRNGMPDIFGAPAFVTVDYVEMRSEPGAEAPVVEGAPAFKKGDALVVLERKGEWYRVTTGVGHEGWVRWRFVEPVAGVEHIFVELGH